jgi:HSP20 family protein
MNTDRERSIATERETSRSGGSTAGSPGLARGVGYSPFSLLRRMTEDMDRLLEHFALGRGLGLRSNTGTEERDLWSGADQSSWMPQVETFRRGDKLVVRADLPGTKREDVNVEVEDGVLTISGERHDEREEKSDEFFRSERSYGQFRRAIPLPQGVGNDQVDATFKDGVLEVAFPAPKQQERKSKIQIR